MTLRNTVKKKKKKKKKKTGHLQDIFPVIQNFLFLYSYYVYFILLQKSEKHVTERSTRFNL